ncbi:MAG TPA: alternative ribosome rescue aminoacyl-tRNA hydrolase ArfB [Gemmatimonadaceae bacterium]|nr:alternative ribosome rescue aminoacyl-tRNA hydrolase ArfB [Gemmatimonadaceae bacterium]
MSDDLRVNERVAIPRAELVARATRSGGPGGQHVNTSSTRVELLWNVRESRALDDAARERVLAKLGTRIDAEGWLRVVASESRSQLRNREAAEERLATLVRDALVVPRKRVRTKPTRAAKERRLSEKKRRGDVKRQRRRWTDGHGG